jgi:hypothetical protein
MVIKAELRNARRRARRAENRSNEASSTSAYSAFRDMNFLPDEPHRIDETGGGNSTEKGDDRTFCTGTHNSHHIGSEPMMKISATRPR